MSKRKPRERQPTTNEHLSADEGFAAFAPHGERQRSEQAFTDKLLSDAGIFETVVMDARLALRDLEQHAMDEAARMAGHDREYWLACASQGYVPNYGLTLEALHDKLREEYPHITIWMVRRIADELDLRGHARWQQVKVRKGEPQFIQQTAPDGTVTISCLEPVQPLERTGPQDFDYETWSVLRSCTPPRLVSTAVASQRHMVTGRHLRRLIQHGDLISYRRGKKGMHLIDEAEVDKLFPLRST